MSEEDAEAVADECEALSAIYGADFEDERYPHPVAVAGTVCVRRFTVRGIALPSPPPCVLVARFLLPAAYPGTAAPVVVLELASSSSSSSSGDAAAGTEHLLAALAQAVRAACCCAGGVCCYDCVELLRSGGDGVPAVARAVGALQAALQARAGAPERPRARAGPAPAIVRGEALCDRKSKFVAFAAVVHSEADVAAVLETLLADRKVAAATHNMVAYRYRARDGSVVAQRDDDGETGAGDKMLYVLTVCREVETLVVVTRWYGGIHLGNDRFRHIVALTRDILECPAFAALRTVPRDSPSPADCAGFSAAKRNLH